MDEKEMQEKIEWIRSQKFDKDENYHSYIEKIEREYQQGTKTKRGNKMKRLLICALVAITISCAAAYCGFSEVEAKEGVCNVPISQQN